MRNDTAFDLHSIRHLPEFYSAVRLINRQLFLETCVLNFHIVVFFCQLCTHKINLQKSNNLLLTTHYFYSMFLDFFFIAERIRFAGQIGEYLNLLEALNKRVTRFSVEEFYFLSKTILIKHEQFLDRYDLLLGNYFHGVELSDADKKEIPKDWLQKEIDRLFSEEEKAMIEKMGGLDKLMERMQQLLEEQKEKTSGWQ